LLRTFFPREGYWWAEPLYSPFPFLCFAGSRAATGGSLNKNLFSRSRVFYSLSSFQDSPSLRERFLFYLFSCLLFVLKGRTLCSSLPPRLSVFSVLGDLRAFSRMEAVPYKDGTVPPFFTLKHSLPFVSLVERCLLLEDPFSVYSGPRGRCPALASSPNSISFGFE